MNTDVKSDGLQEENVILHSRIGYLEIQREELIDGVIGKDNEIVALMHTLASKEEDIVYLTSVINRLRNLAGDLEQLANDAL